MLVLPAETCSFSYPTLPLAIVSMELISPTISKSMLANGKQESIWGAEQLKLISTALFAADSGALLHRTLFLSYSDINI
jgi:hypothetical protein